MKINERLLLITLAAIQFTNIVDFMIMMPLADILQQVLQITPGQFGILVASYPLAAGITAFAGVFYLDNLGRKKAMLWAYAGFIVGTLSTAIVPTTEDPHLNYYLFIGTRLLTGISGGLLGGLVLAIVGDVIPLERRGRAMAVVTIAFSMAAVLGVPLGLTLVDIFDNNWHIPFYFVGAIGIPVWIMAAMSMPAIRDHLNKKEGEYDRFETFRLVLKSREQRNALLFTMLLVLGQFTIISFMTPYYINNVGLEQSQIKWIYLTGGICTAVSGYFIGKMVDKLGRFRIFTIFAFFSAMLILIITNLPIVPFWFVLIIAGFFFVAVSGRMIPANTITTAVVNPRNRGGFMSLNSAAMSLASGLSSVIAGSIITKQGEHSPLQNYHLVGIVAVVSTMLSLMIVRTLRNIHTQDKHSG